MSKINYIHRRYISNGEITNYGGITIAFMETDGHIVYASSHCSPKDNFSKFLGRTKAKGRLDSPHYRKTSDLSFKEFIAQNVGNINLDLY